MSDRGWPRAPFQGVNAGDSFSAVCRQSRIDLGLGVPHETLLRVAGELQVLCRIDDQIATPGLAARTTRASIWKATRFSGHAPLAIDYEAAGG